MGSDTVEPWDVAIIGGGILGTSVSYWIGNQHKGRIAVLEKEGDVAVHTSRRNTGVVHRPFYLDPAKRRVFGRSSQTAYGMWKSYAKARGLPWAPVTTLEVATRPEDLKRVDKYHHWGVENGMGEDELEVLSPEELRKLEPHVRGYGAIWSKTDTAVDYRAFTRSLRADAEGEGVKFLTRFDVAAIRKTGDFIEVLPKNGREPVRTRFLINCAGGSSLRVAHMLGVGLEYCDLNFRGEYWEMGKEWAFLASRNIYKGFFTSPGQAIKKLLEQPVANKLALLYNRDFLELAGAEWLSSISKGEMAKRAQKFIPELKVDYLLRRGIAGVRAQVIDRKGDFMKEAIEFQTPLSYHITNYNSPGATGSPAFAAFLVNKLGEKGYLDHLGRSSVKGNGVWDFETISEQVSAA